MFSNVFVAYLLGPESTLASDLHEAGVVLFSKMPAKLYVPKALSALIEMCPWLNTNRTVLAAKFMQSNPLYTGFDASRGVCMAEQQLVVAHGIEVP